NKNFAIVDAAMNDLLRPSLYGAWQDIIPVSPHDEALPLRWDIVGPVCETGDFLGKDRVLKLAVGDLLAVRSAGAYGFSMSSNYNSRPRAAEVMVDGSACHLVRARETLAQLWAGECLLP
ncbi:MAG: diaminopimelate decarboxylase, partial [Methylovulum sp.]|nr:diaminopimelate decarboxylase [Methylovulum sp.]